MSSEAVLYSRRTHMKFLYYFSSNDIIKAFFHHSKDGSHLVGPLAGSDCRLVKMQ